MVDPSGIGRVLLLVGGVILVLGLVLTFAGRIPLLGRLPGDIELRGNGWTVYAPVATSIVLSLLLTVVIAVVSWLGGRR